MVVELVNLVVETRRVGVKEFDLANHIGSRADDKPHQGPPNVGNVLRNSVTTTPARMVSFREKWIMISRFLADLTILSGTEVQLVSEIISGFGGDPPI